MGIVQRQSVKESLVNYLGVAIGAISAIVLYSREDVDGVYGLARFVIDTGMMLAPFLMLGMNNVVVRFFPEFKEKGKHYGGFLFFVLCGVLLGSILVGLLLVVFKDAVYQLYVDKPPLYQEALPYVLIVAILVAFFNLLNAWSANFGRIAVPSMLQNLIKVALPILIILFLMQFLTTMQVVYGIVISFTLTLLGTIGYIAYLGEWKWRFNRDIFQDRAILKQIRVYAFYGLFGGVGGALATRIDSFMISTLLDFEKNGAYAIAAMIGGTIAIPTRAVTKIAAPLVTQAFKDGHKEEIVKLYKISSINPLIVGLFFFVGIIVSVEDLFAIMPSNKNLEQGLWIVFFIGAAQLVDMATGINTQIINYSKYFRFGFYTILLLAVFNIVANWLLIPQFKIVGAALATFLSMLVYNIIKLVYIYIKLDMQPFSYKTVLLLIVTIVTAIFAWVIPSTGKPFFDIVIKSLLVTVVYLPAVYSLRISADVNAIIDKQLKKWK